MRVLVICLLTFNVFLALLGLFVGVQVHTPVLLYYGMTGWLLALILYIAITRRKND